MLPSIRLTGQLSTPGTLATARSTWAEQAEQVMPVTEKVCFISASLLHQLVQHAHQLVDDLVITAADTVGHAGADVAG